MRLPFYINVYHRPGGPRPAPVRETPAGDLSYRGTWGTLPHAAGRRVVGLSVRVVSRYRRSGIRVPPSSPLLAFVAEAPADESAEPSFITVHEDAGNPASATSGMSASTDGDAGSPASEASTPGLGFEPRSLPFARWLTASPLAFRDPRVARVSHRSLTSHSLIQIPPVAASLLTSVRHKAPGLGFEPRTP